MFGLGLNPSQNAMPSFQTLSLRLGGRWYAAEETLRRFYQVSPSEWAIAVRHAKEILPMLWPATLQRAATVTVVDEVKVHREFTLGKEHWRLAKYSSESTFFENNYGFKPQQQRDLKTCFNNTLFKKFHYNKPSPQVLLVRGFKTRRRSLDNYKYDAATAEYPARGLEGSKAKSVMSKGQVHGGKKKSINFWDKVNKLASILVIVAIVVSLSQIFNFPMLRVSRGANEIAPEDIDVTFDDVKGCDEAKQELQEIVEFLMNPEKFSILGGKLPKGCLLVGPPGTGKTLLARAVAGQAGVPFFHASGSEFDEVLVGQGARRVRDLFRVAKGRAPCVIFIDEIDSVGAKRTSSVLHPYANQTINQLLSEMDGFVSNDGVIVLGATNRSEDLDKALLRPGRFDTRVTVPAPDMKGRREILNLYLSKIKHDDSVDVEKLSKMTVGFTGADLENMVNTAAIRAATDCKDWVTMEDFEFSHDKHVLGTDWKSRVREKDDLKITAYHEAGHTLVAFFTTDAHPLHKVTIVAKGASGGHTAFLPDKDQYHQTKSQFLARMDVSMGGRAAEEIVFGKDYVTGGASSDLESATSIAELMVKSLGMSEKMGLRVIPQKQQLESNDLSSATSEIVDSEINRFLNDAYKRAVNILKSHRRELDLLADALLNYETLDAEDVKAIIDGDHKMVAKKMQTSNNILGMNKSVMKQSGGKNRNNPPTNLGANGEIYAS